MFAHVGEAVGPDDIWSSWGSDPFVYAGIVGSAALYAVGLRDIWARAGWGRGIALWRAGCFFAGLFVCWAALESPIDGLGTALFSGHMIQHELLAVVAAPLIILGTPWLAIVRALPRVWQQRIRRVERRVGAGRRSRRKWWLSIAFVVYVSTFWAWHVPALYDAAVRNEFLHSLQHACFLAGALALWWGVAGRHRYRTPLAGIALLFATLTQGAWGGALFVFATRAYYEPYRDTTRQWGLTPRDDIVAGGVVMWIAGTVFILAAAVLVVAWLGSMERSPDKGLAWKAPPAARPAPKASPTREDSTPVRN